MINNLVTQEQFKGCLLANDIMIESYTVDNVSASAKDLKVTTINVAKDGYRALGIVSYRFANGSSNGNGASWVALYTMDIDENNASVRFRNHYSTDINVKLTISVLYVSNGVHNFVSGGNSQSSLDVENGNDIAY